MSILDRGRYLRYTIHKSWEMISSRWQRTTRYLRSKLKQIKENILPIPAVRLVIRTIKELGADDVSHLAAGVAYYSLLSLFPLILGFIAILGLFLPSESVQSVLYDFFRNNFPGSIDLLESNIRNVINLRGTLGVLSLFFLLWSGTAMFGAISRAINRAWGIGFEQEPPFYKKIPRKLAMIFGFGLLLVSSIGTTTVFTLLSKTDVSWMGTALSIGAGLFAFLLSVIIFLLLYKLIPHTKTYWRHIWPGAVLAAVLFEIAKNLFTFYLSHFVNYEAIYGSVGSVIALLVWVYIGAYILILGAEFSFEYGRIREAMGPEVPIRNMFRKQKEPGSI